MSSLNANTSILRAQVVFPHINQYEILDRAPLISPCLWVSVREGGMFVWPNGIYHSASHQMFDYSAGSFQIMHSLLQYLNILNMQTPDTKTMIS